MSQENVDAVRQVYAYWKRGQWSASADLFDPGLEVVYSTSAFPDAGTYRGGRVALHAWSRWLVPAGDRSGAVKHFMRNSMGIPAPFVALMRLMPMWKGLKATAHTSPTTGRRWASAATGVCPSKHACSMR
jgi:hypothetical protein